MATSFYTKANELRDEMTHAIYPVIFEKKIIEFELNYNKGTIEVLNDDHSTVWVKFNKYNDRFDSLPVTLMALIADCIINA